MRDCVVSMIFGALVAPPYTTILSLGSNISNSNIFSGVTAYGFGWEGGRAFKKVDIDDG